MKKVFLGIMLMGVSTIQAVLPPLYETLAEYKALLENPQLARSLNSGEAIESIQRTDKQFLIITNKRVVTIDIIYEHQDFPGPRRFHFEFPRESSSDLHVR